MLAAKHATTDIPIVAAVMADPVGTGLVASLSRPGGNITGLSNMGPETAGKCVELFRDMIPSLRRVGGPSQSGRSVHQAFSGTDSSRWPRVWNRN
ncbi:MAG: ABC transporter substrate binding protein [Xanthobacteraceae bacterium]